jgi:hypothetical protein
MEPDRIAVSVAKVEAEKILREEKEKYDPIEIWIAEHQKL